MRLILKNFQHIDNAANENESYDSWSQVSWNGSTGISPKEDAFWPCLVLMDHIYFINDSLDIDDPAVQNHMQVIYLEIYMNGKE